MNNIDNTDIVNEAIKQGTAKGYAAGVFDTLALIKKHSNVGLDVELLDKIYSLEPFKEKKDE